MKPVVLITLGDFNGIGPEVTLKAILSHRIRRICHPVLVGSIDVFEEYARRLGITATLREAIPQDTAIVSERPSADSRNSVLVVDLRPYQRPRVTPGKPSEEGGRYAGEAIEAAAELCLNGTAGAMVTAPVSKEMLRRAGYTHEGQTEMLAELCRTKSAAMMLLAGNLRVGLATTHLPLAKISKAVTQNKLLRQLEIIHASLRNDFGIRHPRIALLGLNPHAGENGLLGNEEHREILPAIAAARNKRMHVAGPFPADGFFATHSYEAYDLVLAMYHDQGLIPLKMKGFEMGVNFTAGLPIVRTSPAHGTAFDLAGKGKANPSSMIRAIDLAVQIAHNRQTHNTRMRAS